MEYNPENIFAKILRGELPCTRVFESEHVLAFHDIHPQAPVHVLVIPKGAYVSMADFSARASAEEQAALLTAVGHVARELGLEEPGYRVIANHGRDANQEVPHFHMHILGGRAFGPKIVPPATD